MFLSSPGIVPPTRHALVFLLWHRYPVPHPGIQPLQLPQQTALCKCLLNMDCYYEPLAQCQKLWCTDIITVRHVACRLRTTASLKWEKKTMSINGAQLGELVKKLASSHNATSACWAGLRVSTGDDKFTLFRSYPNNMHSESAAQRKIKIKTDCSAFSIQDDA